MGYVPLNNYNYDSGYRRIQSGPNHQGFIVLTSGSSAYGVNEGIVVPGSPLSGNLINGVWDYDSNWRYVPTTLPNQSGSLDPTPYNASGALDTYQATRIYTRDNVAGAQAASAIGPETGRVNPRGAALQPRANVTRPETYMYYGGGAPDNQDYSPYNTPDANTAAEGKTGGGVTHRNYESSLLTNLLGSQGTSDRSQWRYHQPVHCKTFTETRRSATPGLMSSPLRYVYRGPSTSYNYNYAGELLANKGGFALLNYDDFGGGCDIPPPCPTTTGDPLNPQPGDILRGSSFCTYVSITWYNTGSSNPIGTGDTYTIQESDYFYKIYYVVTYPNGSTAASSPDCLSTVVPPGYGTYWISQIGSAWGGTPFYEGVNQVIAVDKYGNTFIAWQLAEDPNNTSEPFWLYVSKKNNAGEEIWTKRYGSMPSFTVTRNSIILSPDSEKVYVGRGADFRSGPSCELFEISPINGNLINYVYYTVPGTFLSNSFKRIHFDELSNTIILIFSNLYACYIVRVDVNNLTTVYPGCSINIGGSGSGDVILDALPVRSPYDNNKTFLLLIDALNRTIICPLNANFELNVGTTFCTRYGPTVTSPSQYPVRVPPIPIRYLNNDCFIGTDRESLNGAIVIYNENMTPIFRTNTSAVGYTPTIAAVEGSNTEIYVASMSIPNVNNLVPGINLQGTAWAGILKYNVNSNIFTTAAFITPASGKIIDLLDTDISAGGFTINSNTEYVNRATVVLKPKFDSTEHSFGINSIVTMGLSIISSGNYKSINWNNPSGILGGAVATNTTNITGGSNSITTKVSGIFANTGNNGSIITSVGSGSAVIVDFTEVFTDQYGYVNLE
jgi:hypothetical protein